MRSRQWAGGNAEAVKASVAYKALIRIGAVYDLEGTLKNLSLQERLKERQTSIKPLVEEYFAWIKDIFRQGLVLPKSETAKGLAYSINQEEYLKVFLTEYSCAVKPHIRAGGNRQSGIQETVIASLLA